MTIDVACLCAAWCRTCDAYRQVFERIIGDMQRGGAALRSHWIDIEDQADILGEFDVETFPTIVIADRQRIRFAGALTPEPETLNRLLRALAIEAPSGGGVGTVSDEAVRFVERLRAQADGAAGG